MKRRYKLLLIILIGCLITFFINKSIPKNKINLMTIGDSLSLGATSYNVNGISFNDYLSEYLSQKEKLGTYNKEFCINNLDIEDINSILIKNSYSKNKKVPIKQLIDKADILTIALGTDELSYISTRNVDYGNYTEYFIKNYEQMLKTIRSFYNKEIVLISLYDTKNVDKGTIININKKISKLAVEYKCKYVDILAIGFNRNYYFNNESYYINYKGHQAIYNILKKELEI